MAVATAGLTTIEQPAYCCTSAALAIQCAHSFTAHDLEALSPSSLCGTWLRQLNARSACSGLVKRVRVRVCACAGGWRCANERIYSEIENWSEQDGASRMGRGKIATVETGE